MTLTFMRDPCSLKTRILARNQRGVGSVSFLQFAGDPVIGRGQSLFERNRGLPLQNFTQTSVVAVASSDALRFGEIVALADLLPGDLRNHVDQLVDRDHPVLAQVDRLAMIAAHQPVDTFDTVVDVTVGPRLFTVAPYFDLINVVGQGDLATDGRG